MSTLVRGPSLADAVTQTGPLPPAAVGWTALGLARAIATLHRAELTHRAVTPRNVLLGGHGPMLTDFGVNLAALAHGPGSFAEDVFLFGCTVCYAATGRPPWSEWPPGSARSARPAGRPRRPGRRGRRAEPPGDPDLAGCPAGLSPIVAACLAADPQSRPSAEQLVGCSGHRGRAATAVLAAGRGRGEARRLPGAAAAAAPPRRRGRGSAGLDRL